MRTSLVAVSLFLTSATGFARTSETPCYDRADAVPQYLCAYTDTPITTPGFNVGTQLVLEHGTVCLSRQNGSLILKQVEKVREIGSNGRESVDLFSQTVSEDGTTGARARETARILRLIEKAPLLSMMETRSSDFKLKKNTGEGSLRMRFYHGGRLQSKYSDERHPLHCEPISRLPAQ